MSPTLSHIRCIFLLSLAAVMLLSGCGVESLPAKIILPCCYHPSENMPAKITKCFEQKPRWGCWTHAFQITDHRGRTGCVKPSQQINDMMEKNQLECRPDVSLLS
ncbi:uncharacterized protein V3H82_021852 [Fundulus diaphanus]